MLETAIHIINIDLFLECYIIIVIIYLLFSSDILYHKIYYSDILYNIILEYTGPDDA